MALEFAPPSFQIGPAVHHGRAAASNIAVADSAIGQLRDALSGTSDIERILLKAAAGAGKSFVLRRLVADAITHPKCVRVLVIAFTNEQVWALANWLGAELGRDNVCLYASKKRYDEAKKAVSSANVVDSAKEIESHIPVVITTAHLSGSPSVRKIYAEHLSASAHADYPFDVLLVDEAWQLPHHLFDKVTYAAPIHVGVGDVGQIPPLEIGQNPWRGDDGFNPYRAWPTNYSDDDPTTWAAELPAVWRPCGEQLPLWRSFYPEWGELNCVAAPNDRSIALGPLSGHAHAIWSQVATGVPTLVEVAGLPAAEAADVDLPLVHFAEHLLDELISAGFVLKSAEYDDQGTPTGLVIEAKPGVTSSDPLITVLATRNQAVDDATDAVERLKTKHSLAETELVASTVDSWQGKTNGITVAVHPLSGATELDEFNSQFGRLAVACTRATHGLLVLSRPGLDRLLNEAPARPGTPIGEPGNRQLPRQTHERILSTFARARVDVSEGV